jgi:chorismate mutase
MRIAILVKLSLIVVLAGCSRAPDPQAPAHQPDTGPGLAGVQEAMDDLLALMRQRLLTMHDVARCKWHAGLPIDDPKREQDVLDRVVAQGSAVGLEAGLVEKFFRAQMQAGKLVQQADFDHRQKSGQPPPTGGPNLKALRADIDVFNQKVLAALAKSHPMLKQAEGQKALLERISIVLQGEGITEAVRQAACAPLVWP